MFENQLFNGILGKGFNQGTQNHLKYLPVRDTDFIISVIGEEMGLFGIMLIMVSFDNPTSKMKEIDKEITLIMTLFHKQDEDGNDMTVKNMNYSVLYMKAVKALQEAMTKIETLETKVTALENA